jgi:mono/diheme cytochrome c family protein
MQVVGCPDGLYASFLKGDVRRVKKSTKARLVLGCAALVACLPMSGQVKAGPEAARSPVPAAPVVKAAAPAVAAQVAAAQRQLLDQYCVVCHNDKIKTDNFSLEKEDINAVGDHPEVWERVIRKLRAGMMPPPGMPRPPLGKYEGLRDWLETQIDRKAATHPDPGSVVMHRLNRTEYANVIRDLLDLDIDVSTLLPADDAARGFDNVAGSLTISPTLLEAYMTAATRIARTAVGFWKSPTEMAYIAPGDTSQNQHLEGLPFGTRGGMAVRHSFPADGEYKFTVQNFGLGKFIPGEKLLFLIDNETVETRDYAGVGLSSNNSSDNDGTIEVSFPVKAGSHMVGVTFLATNYRPSLDMIRQFERKSLEDNGIPQLQYYPAVGILRIRGPFTPTRPEDTRSIRKVYTCRPSSAAQEEPCANQILTTLMRRAFRRPVTPSDLEWVRGFYQEGHREGTFEDGIELALRRILASPQFLVRAEREPSNAQPGKPYRITDLELASRLSFMIWSSIPDDELINLASRDKLHTSPILEQQVRRMLADRKASALVQNFGDQLLYLRNLPATSPDGVFYPNWDAELRNSFRRETELLFESIIKENRNVVDLLTADYTFLNERLARHYNIPNVYGSQFRRVTLGPDLAYRRGLLGQGSVLSLTWVQNFRTSPVKRGVWVLENILGTPPPEPPPNVPPLEDSKGGENQIMTLREQMTLHRKMEPCASCHKLMDPIGFALENFDADGSWRTKQGGEGGVPLDTSAVLWDGTKVNGPIELRQALLKYSPQFVRTITEKLMTFSLGRGVEYQDMPQVRSIVRDAAKDDYKFQSILMGIIKSPAFQMRTGQLDESARN